MIFFMKKKPVTCDSQNSEGETFSILSNFAKTLKKNGKNFCSNCEEWL